MTNSLFLPTTSLSMSSREIAEYTGKAHFNVIRDIRAMLKELNLTELSFGATYKDSTGRTLPMFNLPEEMTFTLIAGYSIPLRHAIVTRMSELEAKQKRPPMKFSEALRLAAEKCE